MKEILKKLPVLDRKSIENAMEMIKEQEQIPNREHLCEHLRWRIYGMADILLDHQIITADEYCVLVNASKWGVA